MDSEKALTIDQGKPHKAGSCCRKTLLVAALFLGTLACILSTCTLVVQLLSMEQQQQEVPLLYTAQQEQHLLNQVAQYLHDSEYNETAGKRIAKDTACSSLYDSTLTVKPSAHLSGNSLGSARIAFVGTYRRLTPVLSAGWSCQEGIRRMNHVLGGMEYNSDNGFLKVPVDGIYFVYSQILLNVTSSDGNTRPTSTKLGHMTVMCTCNDASQLNGNCYCYTVRNDLPYNDETDNLIGSYSWYQGPGGSNYHGGLFHLTANSYVAVVPIIPDRGSSQASIIATNIGSFFGAFYVTGLTLPSPTATPSPSI